RIALTQHAAVPLNEWAQLQQGLGNALAWLGYREGSTARIEEAIAAYEPVLTETMRKRLPLEWAMGAVSQGVTFMELAERVGDVRSAQTAVTKLSMALEATRDTEHNQLTAYHETQLAKARKLLDRLSN